MFVKYDYGFKFAVLQKTTDKTPGRPISVSILVVEV